MPRLMSVAFTEDAVRAQTKTVTRRAGWSYLAPGDVIDLCRKVMGRRRGEPLVRVARVRVVSVRREHLHCLLMDPAYGAAEMTAEGFPGLDPAEFIRRYFIEVQRLDARAEVTRVEWEYLPRPEDWPALA